MNVLPKAKTFDELSVIEKINILAQEDIPDKQFLRMISDYELCSEAEVTGLADILEQHRPKFAKQLAATM